MDHTSAEIVTQFLKDEGVLEAPGVDADWPVYVSHLPPGKSIPQASAVTDTQGIMDGRIMVTGEMIEHPGFQIRTRSRSHSDGFKKLHSIAEVLSRVQNKLIVLPDGMYYTMFSISRISSILPMGVEPDTRLFLFSANFTATLKSGG